MKINKKEYLAQFAHMDLKVGTRLVINAFASFAGCPKLFMHQEAILERAGVKDKRTLRNAINFLVNNEFLEVSRSGTANEYKLLLNTNFLQICGDKNKRKDVQICTQDAQKSKKTLCSNMLNNSSKLAHNNYANMYTYYVQTCTLSTPLLYIYNYNYNIKSNYKSNCKNENDKSLSFSRSFVDEKNICKNDCQNEKTEIENLLAENQKLKNALEALELKNKALSDEILNLNKKIEIYAVSASKNDIELQNLKAENEKLKEKREKREIAEQKKIEKINQNSAKWASDEEIENFRFEKKHIDACVEKKWTAEQIKLAESVLVSKMQARKERDKEPFKSPSLLALNYIRSGYLDDAVSQTRKYNNSTNNDVNSKSYNVDNIHKVELARMREEEQQRKSKTFDVDFDPEEFVREFKRDNNIEDLPARPEPVRQNLFGIGTRR